MAGVGGVEGVRWSVFTEIPGEVGVGGVSGEFWGGGGRGEAPLQ